jgi:iron complex outermembrane receptor protein
MDRCGRRETGSGSALRRVPGLTISRYNPIGSYGGGDGGAVFVRGQGSGRPGAEITMMVDGIPKFVGVWTHPLLDLLSVDLVHQVDVLQGRPARPPGQHGLRHRGSRATTTLEERSGQAAGEGRQP